MLKSKNDLNNKETISSTKNSPQQQLFLIKSLLNNNTKKQQNNKSLPLLSPLPQQCLKTENNNKLLEQQNTIFDQFLSSQQQKQQQSLPQQQEQQRQQQQLQAIAAIRLIQQKQQQLNFLLNSGTKQQNEEVKLMKNGLKQEHNLLKPFLKFSIENQLKPNDNNSEQNSMQLLNSFLFYNFMTTQQQQLNETINPLLNCELILLSNFLDKIKLIFIPLFLKVNFDTKI